MNYSDFTLRARDWEDGQFKVEVISSPIDRMREPSVGTYDEAALAHPLRELERKRIRLKALMALGEAMSDMLLPPPVREMLLRSLDVVGHEEGLRLRLVLDDPPVANLPWEYLYLHRAGGEKSRDGFLALDPRISLTRHEAIPVAPGSVKATRPLKLVVGLSSPSDAMWLDLETERGFIEQALSEVDGVELTFVEALTVEKLESVCQGAHIFHFAGHGAFAHEFPTLSVDPSSGDVHFVGQESQMGGGGVILLEDAEGSSHFFPAENLALTLRGGGVRLVVLGACETGRRDGVNVWNGVAPALMRANIPAAVAMQYEICDASASAFARRFYQALAAGLSLDEAVAAGRLAILNLGGEDDVDWGVPVLYMRSPDGVIFPEVAADSLLATARDRVRVAVRQRVQELRGKVVGVEAEEMTDVSATVEQKTTTVHEGGELIGVKVKKLGGADS